MLAYTYNAKAQLEEIRDGSGRLLERMEYDAAGRMRSWKNRDSESLWEAFDAEGRPKKTTQRRFRNGTGLEPSPVMLDEYVQEHRYNEHGERSLWSMPVYAGLTLGAGWTKWIRQDYDAVGNLATIAKVDELSATSALVLMDGTFHNAGRPERRTIFTGRSTSSGAPVAIVRTYDYDPATGLMKRVEVSAGAVVVAGADITCTTSQKVSGTHPTFGSWVFSTPSRRSEYQATTPTWASTCLYHQTFSSPDTPPLFTNTGGHFP